MRWPKTTSASYGRSRLAPTRWARAARRGLRKFATSWWMTNLALYGFLLVFLVYALLAVAYLADFEDVDRPTDEVLTDTFFGLTLLIAPAYLPLPLYLGLLRARPLHHRRRHRLCPASPATRARLPRLTHPSTACRVGAV